MIILRYGPALALTFERVVYHLLFLYSLLYVSILTVSVLSYHMKPFAVKGAVWKNKGFGVKRCILQTGGDSAVLLLVCLNSPRKYL